jgi:uncharacterized protein Yka (UPF0111/DUF47 family)
VKATSTLVELVEKYDNISEYLSKITDMEHEGDGLAQKLFNIIDQTFVTPIDREDICRLTSSIDGQPSRRYRPLSRLHLALHHRTYLYR